MAIGDALADLDDDRERTRRTGRVCGRVDSEHSGYPDAVERAPGVVCCAGVLESMSGCAQGKAVHTDQPAVAVDLEATLRDSAAMTSSAALESPSTRSAGTSRLCQRASKPVLARWRAAAPPCSGRQSPSQHLFWSTIASHLRSARVRVAFKDLDELLDGRGASDPMRASVETAGERGLAAVKRDSSVDQDGRGAAFPKSSQRRPR